MQHAVLRRHRGEAAAGVVVAKDNVCDIFHTVPLVDPLACVVVDGDGTGVGVGLRDQCHAAVAADRSENNVRLCRLGIDVFVLGVQAERRSATLKDHRILFRGRHAGILIGVLSAVSGITVHGIQIQIGIMQQEQRVVHKLRLIAGIAGDGQRKVSLRQRPVILCHGLIPASDSLQLRHPHVPLDIEITAEYGDQ